MQHESTQAKQLAENKATSLDDKAEQIAAIVEERIIASKEEFFSGPIPHPSIVEGYEKILPGAADRILAMAEKEGEFRHSYLSKKLSVESRDSLLGIILASAICASLIVVGIFAFSSTSNVATQMSL